MGCCNSFPKELLKSDEPFYKLHAKVRIWNRESHGLFDYDLKSISESKIELLGNLFIYGNSDGVKALLPSINPTDGQSKRILSIAYKNGRYWAYHPRDFSISDSLKAPAEQPWIPLKCLNSTSFKNKYHPKFGYKLKKGDIIKFGRVRFRVSAISNNKDRLDSVIIK